MKYIGAGQFALETRFVGDEVAHCIWLVFVQGMLPRCMDIGSWAITGQMDIPNVSNLMELLHDCCACHSSKRFCNAAKRSALAASGPTAVPFSGLSTLRVISPV